jgi:hypothetical protein
MSLMAVRRVGIVGIVEEGEKGNTVEKNKNDKENKRRGILYLFAVLAPLKIKPPTIPAATAKLPTMATPTKPSLATFSSINCLKLSACRFPGSKSTNNSLYRLASAYDPNL